MEVGTKVSAVKLKSPLPNSPSSALCGEGLVGVVQRAVFANFKFTERTPPYPPLKEGREELRRL
jgi:hypothetical protein